VVRLISLAFKLPGRHAYYRGKAAYSYNMDGAWWSTIKDISSVVGGVVTMRIKILRVADIPMYFVMSRVQVKLREGAVRLQRQKQRRYTVKGLWTKAGFIVME